MDAARTAQLGTEEALRQAGLRVTRPRLLVLGLLREMSGHRSADGIVAALRERGTPLPRGSVYNVIEALVQRGVIMLADAGPGRALYEAGESWHHHFVCSQCGRIVDVPCADGQSPCIDAGEIAGEVEEAQVIFRGRCLDCTAAA